MDGSSATPSALAFCSVGPPKSRESRKLTVVPQHVFSAPTATPVREDHGRQRGARCPDSVDSTGPRVRAYRELLRQRIHGVVVLVDARVERRVGMIGMRDEQRRGEATAMVAAGLIA